MLGKVALISLSLPFMSLGLCWLALCLTSPEFIIHAFSAFGGHRDRDFFFVASSVPFALSGKIRT